MDCKCPFSITIFLHPRDHCWYLATAHSCKTDPGASQQTDPGVHFSHPPLLANLTNAGSNKMSVEDQNLQHLMLEAGCNNISITNDYCSNKSIFEEMWKIAEHSTPLQNAMEDGMRAMRSKVVNKHHMLFPPESLVDKEGTYDFGALAMDTRRKAKRPKYGYERK